MTESEVLLTLNRILGDLLDDETITLSPETIRGAVDGWDSFQYVNFIVAVEVEYGIQFRVADVESFITVGDIVTQTLKLKNQ
jgi:acyl carrier protein